MCGFAFELHLYFFDLLLLKCRFSINYYVMVWLKHFVAFWNYLRNLLITAGKTLLFLCRLERQCKSFFKHFLTNQKVTSATHIHFSRQSLKYWTPFFIVSLCSTIGVFPQHALKSIFIFEYFYLLLSNKLYWGKRIIERRTWQCFIGHLTPVTFLDVK